MGGSTRKRAGPLLERRPRVQAAGDPPRRFKRLLNAQAAGDYALRS
jgi:hypothetical protein